MIWRLIFWAIWLTQEYFFLYEIFANRPYRSKLYWGILDEKSNMIEEYFELLAMPRERIMFRSHFENNGTTLRWQQLLRGLSSVQKEELKVFVSHTVSELKTLPCPEQFREILPFYLIKYKGKEEKLSSGSEQLSLFDDSGIVVEDE